MKSRYPMNGTPSNPQGCYHYTVANKPSHSGSTEPELFINRGLLVWAIVSILSIVNAHINVSYMFLLILFHDIKATHCLL
jgi:hypothetical protein